MRLLAPADVISRSQNLFSQCSAAGWFGALRKTMTE
jgi:hypothetical protein